MNAADFDRQRTQDETPCGPVVQFARKVACARCGEKVGIGVVSECDCATTFLCRKCACRDEFALIDAVCARRHRRFCGRHQSS